MKGTSATNALIPDSTHERYVRTLYFPAYSIRVDGFDFFFIILYLCIEKVVFPFYKAILRNKAKNIPT